MIYHNYFSALFIQVFLFKIFQLLDHAIRQVLFDFENYGTSDMDEKQQSTTLAKMGSKHKQVSQYG